MMKLFPFLALLLALCSRSSAAEPSDLGYNLSYLRVHSLAEAAPALHSALSVKHACILDLRYTTANDDSVAALRQALTGHPAGSPLFILISPSTPAGVVNVLPPAAPGALVTLGVAGSHPAPSILVKTSAATDRQAYDAFESGTPLTDLLSGKIEKERYDEASLVQEFKSGNPDPEPPLTPDPTETKADKAPEKPPLLIDHVLQRALQLHRALLALRP